MQRLTETILPFLPPFFKFFFLQYGVVLSVSAVTDTHKPGYRRTVVLLSFSFFSLRFFVSLMILPYIHPPLPFPILTRWLLVHLEICFPEYLPFPVSYSPFSWELVTILLYLLYTGPSETDRSEIFCCLSLAPRLLSALEVVDRLYARMRERALTLLLLPYFYICLDISCRSKGFFVFPNLFHPTFLFPFVCSRRTGLIRLLEGSFPSLLYLKMDL